jgi:eukaryotic-like serine/threonine-protein kinase
MAGSLPHLGPWLPTREVGRGSAGRVWHATHATLGVDAAIKVLDRGGQVDALLREVRHVASLSHPHVVEVVDIGLGEVPWFAMEWAAAGSLLGWMDRALQWPQVREVASSLLSGLAHAHARGLVHRDVKPENVLVCDTGLKLTDFGISWSREGMAPKSAGSLPYMPPEQLRGDWRSFGPGTDLYALGATLWHLITGSPPHGASTDVCSSQEMIQAHLAAALPSLLPRLDVPAGLERWLARMLHKDVADRFPDAATARAQLLQLGPAMPGRRAEHPAEASGVAAPTFDDWRVTPRPVVRVAAPRAGSEVTPLPESWSRDEGGVRALRGAGLRLLGLRVPPLVGRESERDVLWGAFLRAAQLGTPQAVNLRGAAGIGKTRLARWIGERAHELAGAVVMVGQDPLAMVVEHLRLEGLDAAETTRHLARHLPDLAGDLCGLYGAALAGTGEGAHGAALRVVAALSARRPVVLVVLSCTPGSERAREGLARFFRARAARVLVVYEGATDSQAGLASLEGHRVLTLEPLTQAQCVRLAESLVGLTRLLSMSLAVRSGGNPAFLVQLLQHIAPHLQPQQGGYAHPAPDSLGLPMSLVDAQQSVLAAALRGLTERDQDAASIGLLLGSPLERSLWTQACALAGVSDSPWLVEHLTRTGVLREVGAGVFHHGQPLLGHAVGRAALHRAVAHALLGQEAPDPGRIGAHLFHAGDFEQALEHLAAGVHAQSSAFQDADAIGLAELAERAWNRLGQPVGTGIWQVWKMRAADAMNRGSDTQAAESWIRKILEEGPQDRRTRVVVLSSLADIARIRSDHRSAVAWASEAVAEASSEEGLVQWAQLGLGEQLHSAGSLDAAETQLAGIERRFPLMWISAQIQLAGVACSRGDHATQRAILEGAADEVARTDNPSVAFAYHNELGEAARGLGELAVAHHHYERADAIAREHGFDLTTPVLNLGVLLLQEGDPRTALRLMLSRMRADLRTDRWFQAEIIVAAATAQLGDWEALQRRWERLEPHAGRFADRDSVWMFDEVVRCTQEAGWTELAEAVLAARIKR